jgi:hypothetical protein
VTACPRMWPCRRLSASAICQTQATANPVAEPPAPLTIRARGINTNLSYRPPVRGASLANATGRATLNCLTW